MASKGYISFTIPTWWAITGKKNSLCLQTNHILSFNNRKNVHFFTEADDWALRYQIRAIITCVLTCIMQFLDAITPNMHEVHSWFHLQDLYKESRDWLDLRFMRDNAAPATQTQISVMKWTDEWLIQGSKFSNLLNKPTLIYSTVS